MVTDRLFPARVVIAISLFIVAMAPASAGEEIVLGGASRGILGLTYEAILARLSRSDEANFCVLVLPDGENIASNILAFSLNVSADKPSSSINFTFSPGVSANASRYSFSAMIPVASAKVERIPLEGYSKFSYAKGFGEGFFAHMASIPRKTALIPPEITDLAAFSFTSGCPGEAAFRFASLIPRTGEIAAQDVALRSGPFFSYTARAVGQTVFSHFAGIPKIVKPQNSVAISPPEASMNFSFGGRFSTLRFSFADGIPIAPPQKAELPVMGATVATTLKPTFSFSAAGLEGFFTYGISTQAPRSATLSEKGAVVHVEKPDSGSSSFFSYKMSLDGQFFSFGGESLRPYRTLPRLRISASKSVLTEGDELEITLSVEGLESGLAEEAIVFMLIPHEFTLDSSDLHDNASVHGDRLLSWAISPADVARGAASLVLKATVSLGGSS